MRHVLTKLEESLKFRTRFKFIEEMGRSVREMVVQKDPDPQACGRLNCMLCRSKPGSCLRKGVVYKITCMTCMKEEKPVVYVGETARSGWDMMAEQARSMRKKNLNPQ